MKVKPHIRQTTDIKSKTYIPNSAKASKTNKKTYPAWQAQKEEREGEGEKYESGKKGKKVPYSLSLIPLPFSLPPYPLRLLTPATQAKKDANNTP